MLAAINHPNVVAIHDVEPADPSTDAGPFLVMDLCDGGSLADRLAASATGALPPDQLIPILVDVAIGLDALHSLGIVHRDLKPSNILLADGRARIADLGIAADGPSELTDAGTMVGTLAYLAPEQLAWRARQPGERRACPGGHRLPRDNRTAPPPRRERGRDRGGEQSAGRPGIAPRARPGPGVRSGDRTGTRRRAIAASVRHRPRDRTERRACPPADRSEAGGCGGRDDADLGTDPGPGDSALDPAAVGGRDGPIVATVTILVAAVVLGTIFVLLLALAGGSADRASPAPSIGPTDSGSSPSPSASTSPSPSPTSSASLAPTPTVDPFTTAGTASTDMRAVIASSRGKGGLKGREAKDLEGLLDQFDLSVRDRDASAAREAANKVVEQVAALIERQAIDDQTAAQLQTASDRLRAIANALPG